MAQPAGLTTVQGAFRSAVNELAEALTNDEITLAQWQEAMLREIKRHHIASGTMGKTGRTRMTAADWGRMGARLREEYGALRGFADDIATGNLSVAQIFQRAQLYSNHAQMTYWDNRRAFREENGMTEERRRTNPGERCDDCIGYEAEGWQPIGYFPPPGQRSVCQANCNCTMEYRRPIEFRRVDIEIDAAALLRGG
jgi:hypothetical protein